MSPDSPQLRSATTRGSRHVKGDINNQDARLTSEFMVGKRTYQVGLVSDGCSGIAAYSRTEVGANLLVLTALAQIQALVAGGYRVADIPAALHPRMTAILSAITGLVAPPGTFLPYPGKLPERERFRLQFTAAERFRADYLSATLLGFVDDGTTLVTFTYGDGVVIINDQATTIDQRNTPDYLAMAPDRPGGFTTETFASPKIWRVVLATDGLEPILRLEGGVSRLFNQPNPYGLQGSLNVLRRTYPELLTDDCTVVLRQRTPVAQEVTDDAQENTD